jgi:hypothetical protein
MAENTEKVQINFQVSPEDAVAIDALAKQDGDDKRASWIRRIIRREISRRILSATVKALPHPTGAQVVPDVTLTLDSGQGA